MRINRIKHAINHNESFIDVIDVHMFDTDVLKLISETSLDKICTKLALSS